MVKINSQNYNDEYTMHYVYSIELGITSYLLKMLFGKGFLAKTFVDKYLLKQVQHNIRRCGLFQIFLAFVVINNINYIKNKLLLFIISVVYPKSSQFFL